MVLNMKLEGSRSMVCPRLKWLDNIEDNLRRLGIRYWKWLTASRPWLLMGRSARNDDDDMGEI